MNLSVLLSVYKNEKPNFLSACLDSLFNSQTLKPDQIILIEDGPLPNNLIDIINKFQHEVGEILIRVKNEKNMGLGYSLNRGLNYCNCKYIARMDTDDIAISSRFEEQVAFMDENPNIDLSGTFSIEIDIDGNKGKLRKMPIKDDHIKKCLWTNPFIHPTVIFKFESLKKVGGYDTNLRRRQDYELWFRCALNDFIFANLNKPLLLYRFDENTHKKQSKEVCKIQAEIGFKGSIDLGLGYIKASLCYFPFLRSFFPEKIQHIIYKTSKIFDPRSR